MGTRNVTRMAKTKARNIGIRFKSVGQLDRIKSAARLSKTPWCTFIRESAIEKAERLLADERAERVLRVSEKSA